jgi:hypothetical protein
MTYPLTITANLSAIYEDLLWLANREHVSPARARTWYSAVWADALKTKIRMFSGRVSRAALLDINGRLCLEHYNKLSESLTILLTRHITEQINDPKEFIKLIEQCELVNITTDTENHKIQAAKGDYAAAGIQLVEWQDIPPAEQFILWRARLRGKVANSDKYAPRAAA